MRGRAAAGGDSIETIFLKVECGGSGIGRTPETGDGDGVMNGRDECVLARQVIAEADADKKNTQKELNSLIKDLKVHMDSSTYSSHHTIADTE